MIRLWLQILLGVFVIVAGHAMAGAPQVTDDTVTFSTDAKVTLESNRVTVLAAINATVTHQDPQAAQASIMQQLQSYAPEVTWHVVSVDQQTVASGANNITLKLWAQVSQAVLTPLNQHLKQSHSGYTINLTVMNYDPSEAAVRQAKEALMIQLYQNIQTYVTQFDQATQQNYRIQTVRFSSMSPQPLRAISMIAEPQKRGANSQSKPMPIAKAIQLTAFVTLAQSGNQPPAQRIGQGVLPPAYLKVKNFKACLAQADQGTWKAWCLPSQRPKNCPVSSWKQLQVSPARDGLSICS